MTSEPLLSTAVSLLSEDTGRLGSCLQVNDPSHIKDIILAVITSNIIFRSLEVPFNSTVSDYRLENRGSIVNGGKGFFL
jgi:hypothetical protein